MQYLFILGQTPSITPEWISFIRPYLELLNFASGIILAAASWFAFIQIKLARKQIEITKQDIQLRSKREAVSLAAHQCEKFAKEILSNNTKNFKELSLTVKIRRWQLSNTDLDIDAFDAKTWNEAQEWLTKIQQKQQIGILCSIANELEAFAMYFSKGAADEEVAFSAIGIAFCSLIEQIAPYLMFLRAKKITGLESGNYPNLVRLYGLWKNKIKKIALESEHVQISEKLKTIQCDSIKPIGT